MSNKKRISKLLKNKYKPSKGRLVKYYNDFHFGFLFGAYRSELKKALNKVAEVTKVINIKPRQFTPSYKSAWKIIFEKNFKKHSFVGFRNEYLNYPISKEPSLLELKRRVNDLEFLLRNTQFGTEIWLENVTRLHKAKIDFRSMWEKKLKPRIAEIFEYSFEKEYLSNP